MTPEEFEHYVGAIYTSEGYDVKVSPLTNDWGIDVIASKGREKIGIQVKMYGHTSRKVNRAMIMELHGASAYQDCTRAVLATDGDILPDAVKVANKLGVEIKYINISNNLEKDITVKKDNQHNIQEETYQIEHQSEDYPTFGVAWEKYIKPLEGSEIQNDGLINLILKVDNSGIKRVTSQGNIGIITYEGFKLAYDKIIGEGFISRDDINQNIAKRCSSGIVLVLSQIPFIEAISKPKGLRLKSNKL